MRMRGSQLRRRHRYCPIRLRWPDEATAFQPLGEQAHALSIVPKHLDQGATARFIMHPFVRVRAVG
jgi:hypothetical protein